MWQHFKCFSRPAGSQWGHIRPTEVWWVLFIYIFWRLTILSFLGGRKGRWFHHFRSLCYERLFFSTWSSFNSARKCFILCKIKRRDARCQAQVVFPKLLAKQPEKPPVHFIQMASCELNDSSQGCRYPQLCSTGPWESTSRGRRMRSLLRAEEHICNTTGTSPPQPKCLVTSVMVTWKKNYGFPRWTHWSGCTIAPSNHEQVPQSASCPSAIQVYWWFKLKDMTTWAQTLQGWPQSTLMVQDGLRNPWNSNTVQTCKQTLQNSEPFG